MSCVAVPCHDYGAAVREAFAAASGAEAVAGDQPILLKPNLVNASPFPVTTHPDFVAAVIETIREHSSAPMVIAEGCGAMELETGEVFARLGYDCLADRYDVVLLDLNHAPLMRRENPECTVFPEMWLPEAAFTHRIVSLPVLKAHSLAEMTGTLKNMMGFPPPSHYQRGGWKKSAFHERMHASIRDLCRYIMPHFTIMDGSVGLSQYHLGGSECCPPIQRILAGSDALAVDRKGCELLGIRWQDVGYLR